MDYDYMEDYNEMMDEVMDDYNETMDETMENYDQYMDEYMENMINTWMNTWKIIRNYG